MLKNQKAKDFKHSGIMFRSLYYKFASYQE